MMTLRSFLTPVVPPPPPPPPPIDQSGDAIDEGKPSDSSNGMALGICPPLRRSHIIYISPGEVLTAKKSVVRSYVSHPWDSRWVRVVCFEMCVVFGMILLSSTCTIVSMTRKTRGFLSAVSILRYVQWSSTMDCPITSPPPRREVLFQKGCKGNDTRK